MGSSMRVDVLRMDRLRLACSAAALAVLGLAAGCSSDVARFDDGFYTGAVPQQAVPRADIGGQAYPAPVDGVNTGSVDRSATGMPAYGYGTNPGAGIQGRASEGDGGQTYPAGRGAVGRDRQRSSGTGGEGALNRSASVERSMLAPPTASQAPAVENALPDRSPVDTPAARQPAPKAAGVMKAGWNNTGTSVVLRQGETIETLSNRFGVPAKALLAANGMKTAGEAQPGQQIIVPSYSYGSSSPAGRAAAAQTAPAGQLGSAPLRASPVAASGSKASSIVVGSGDSVLGIARRAGVSADALRSANNLTGDNIRIGQKLVLPDGATAPKQVAALDIKPAKAAPKIAAEVKPAAAAQPKPYEAPHAASVQPAEPEQAPAPAAAKVETPATSVEAETETEAAVAAPAGTGIDQFRWPVQGRVVSRFGEKTGARRSDGLDISVPRGTPVKAAENGVVIYAGDGLKEFGNTILVKHDNGLVTVYGHADGLKVKRGETVRRGQEIATAGMSGDTETPKVHFEVRKNSAPVDPMKFLK